MSKTRNYLITAAALLSGQDAYVSVAPFGATTDGVDHERLLATITDPVTQVTTPALCAANPGMKPRGRRVS
jgi:hypothetical protein